MEARLEAGPALPPRLAGLGDGTPLPFSVGLRAPGDCRNFCLETIWPRKPVAGAGPATGLGWEAKVLAGAQRGLSQATPNASPPAGSIRLAGTRGIVLGWEKSPGSLHLGNEQTNKLRWPLRGLAGQAAAKHSVAV